MPIVDLAIHEQTCKVSELKAADLREHHQKCNILHLVNSAGHHEVRASQQKETIKIALILFIANAILTIQSTRLQSVGLLEIIVLIQINDMTATIWVVLHILNQITDNLVVIHGLTIALTYGAVTNIPLVPPGYTILSKSLKTACLIFVDPENFTNTAHYSNVSKRKHRKVTFTKIISLHNMVHRIGMCWCTIRVLWARIKIVRSMLKNVSTDELKTFICTLSSSFLFCNVNCLNWRSN